MFAELGDKPCFGEQKHENILGSFRGRLCGQGCGS